MKEFYFYFLFFILSCTYSDSVVSNKSNKNNTEISIVDSLMPPLFFHARYTGYIDSSAGYIDFTLKYNGLYKDSIIFVAAYFHNLKDGTHGQLCCPHNYEQPFIDFKNGDSITKMHLFSQYETNEENSVIMHGFLDKKSHTFTSKKQIKEITTSELPFYLKEDTSVIIDKMILPKFEMLINKNYDNKVKGYNNFAYAYYDSKLVSGIFTFEDSTRFLGKNSNGCSNYAYTYNIKYNELIDIDKIFKQERKSDLINFLDTTPNIMKEYLRNGRFFVIDSGLFFVTIGGKDCYSGDYLGHQYFLPFSAIRSLGVLDEAYCRKMDISIER